MASPRTGTKPVSPRPVGSGSRRPLLPLIFTRLNKSDLSPGRHRQHLLPERGAGLLAALGGGDSGQLWSHEEACLFMPVIKRGFPHTYGVPLPQRAPLRVHVSPGTVHPEGIGAGPLLLLLL